MATQEPEENGNSQAWRRLITHVQSGWIDPGNRVEAVLETIMYLRNNPTDAESLLMVPEEADDVD